MKQTIISILLISLLAIYSCRKENVAKATDVICAFCDTINNGQSWTIDANTDSINSNSIYSICNDNKGNMWFGTESGISKFDGNKWTNYYFHKGFDAEYISSDLDGNIWFSITLFIGESISSKIIKFDGSNLAAYTDRHYVVLSQCIDSAGNKWFGTWGRGILKYDITNKEIIHFSSPWDSSSRFQIHAIAIDSNGDKWIGTWGGGVLKFDGTDWFMLRIPSNLARDINTVLIDKNQNKWFGTNNGILEFDGSKWISHRDSSGYWNNIVSSSTIDSKGNLWFGTYAGVSKFDGTKWATYTTANGLRNNTVNAIAVDDKDNIWVGSNGGGVSRIPAAK
jgi:ligand-binding sensor domain-containing protein